LQGDHNVLSTTPGAVLIAGLDDAHRTEITLDGVRVEGVTLEQVHGRFATMTLGPAGTNLDFSKTDIMVVSIGGAVVPSAFSCEGKFVPMQ
jgi:polygalacturonase